MINLSWSTILIGTASKLPQVFSNFSARSTGQLSAITVGLQFIGSAARIFTTLQEVKDVVILTSFLAATTLNGVIALQMITYWKNGSNIKVTGSTSVPVKVRKKGMI